MSDASLPVTPAHIVPISDQKWLEWAHEMMAIAQSGLTYTKDNFELERFQWLKELSERVFAEYTNVELAKVHDFYSSESGYCTPKVDVRSAVFFKDEILMVQEKVDQKWSLPGGWADVNLSPGEVAVKETLEESGFEVEPVKLLAVFDRRRHGHPPGPFYIYKIIIQCQIIGGKPCPGPETMAADFFRRDNLPPLSEGRITRSQIHKLFQFLDDLHKPALFD